MAKEKVGTNLAKLPVKRRRAIWAARKRAQRAELCPKGKEAHHPNYRTPNKVVCVTPKRHAKLSHKH